MNDVKNNVAKNITELRILNNMTQLELAEKLNYSDKTVSKWERAESTPDLSVLVEIAELFNVSLDSLVKTKMDEEPAVIVEAAPVKKEKYNRHAISYVAEGGVWIISMFAFVITTLILGKMSFQWLYFVYTLPVVLIVKLVFNSIWFNTRHNYLIISALMWSILGSVHITFLYFGGRVDPIYLLGVVGQIVIIISSFITKPKTK